MKQPKTEPAQPASMSSEKDLLQLANEQLRKKERLLREAKKKLEGLEGRNLENKSKNELLMLQKQLTDV